MAKSIAEKSHPFNHNPSTFDRLIINGYLQHLHSFRFEVTINNPKGFKILKEKVQDGKLVRTKEWTPMGKSIANLYRYAEIIRSIIKRYLAAMPEIPVEKVPEKEILAVSASKEVNGRRYSGFKLLSDEMVRLLSTIASGDFILNGFDLYIIVILFIGSFRCLGIDKDGSLQLAPFTSKRKNRLQEFYFSQSLSHNSYISLS